MIEIDVKNFALKFSAMIRAFYKLGLKKPIVSLQLNKLQVCTTPNIASNYPLSVTIRQMRVCLCEIIVFFYSIE